MADLLRTLLLVEAGILALLFLVLLAWPVVVRVVEARRARQRRDLLAAVWNHRPGDAPGEVLGALADTSPKALLWALEAVEEGGLEPEDLDLDRLIRGTPAFGRLERAARSVFWWRRQTAAQLLARLGRPESDRSLLVSLLRDPHPAVSSAALLTARELGWPGLVEPLLDLASGGGPATRGKETLLRETLSALDADVAPALRSRLRATVGQPEELTLLRIAGQLADEELLPYLRERLRHGGLEVRVQAVKTVGEAGMAGATDALRSALQDPAWQVRTQAARALGELEAEDAAGDLQRSLSDPSWWVRLRAALALRRLGEPGHELLQSTDPGEDQYAADMARYVLGLEDAALREYAR
ncbi:MAG: HEAT repeat domain-containing protein [Candidatus Palauibacterales bacterium]|nr:HEAT repeat domain-containing protein [Candidatus Palauibacterales bacterium]